MRRSSAGRRRAAQRRARGGWGVEGAVHTHAIATHLDIRRVRWEAVDDEGAFAHRSRRATLAHRQVDESHLHLGRAVLRHVSVAPLFDLDEGVQVDHDGPGDARRQRVGQRALAAGDAARDEDDVLSFPRLLRPQCRARRVDGGREVFHAELGQARQRRRDLAEQVAGPARAVQRVAPGNGLEPEAHPKTEGLPRHGLRTLTNGHCVHCCWEKGGLRGRKSTLKESSKGHGGGAWLVRVAAGSLTRGCRAQAAFGSRSSKESKMTGF